MTTAFEATERSARSVANIGARFMLDPAVYAAGDADHGFHGMDFYFVGRGGMLGDVEPAVAAAAFGFFPPAVVELMWASGTSVMAASQASREYVAACAKWGCNHFGADIDYAELAELSARVVAAGPTAGFPLFAGWQKAAASVSTDDAKGAAMVLLTALRELRGGAHLVAVTAAGVEPLDAVLHTGGVPNAQLFGYAEPYPDVSQLGETMEAIERTTNRIVSLAYEALDSSELDHFVDLTKAASIGITD